MQEVKEGLKLDNLRTDHVMIRSELQYLIGAKIVDLKCRVFGSKIAPIPTVRVIRVVRPVSTVRFQVEPNPEPTREFGPIANTRCGVGLGPVRSHQEAELDEALDWQSWTGQAWSGLVQTG
jgi:hypothetical protein